MVRTSPRTRLVRIPGPAHYAHAINVVRLVYHRAVKLFRISRSELYTDPYRYTRIWQAISNNIPGALLWQAISNNIPSAL